MPDIDPAIAENLHALSGSVPWEQLAAEHAHDADIEAFCLAQAGEAPVEPAPAPPAPSDPPKANASKAAWVEYAVAQGVDEAEVETSDRPRRSRKA